MLKALVAEQILGNNIDRCCYEVQVQVRETVSKAGIKIQEYGRKNCRCLILCEVGRRSVESRKRPEESATSGKKKIIQPEGFPFPLTSNLLCCAGSWGRNFEVFILSHQV